MLINFHVKINRSKDRIEEKIIPYNLNGVAISKFILRDSVVAWPQIYIKGFTGFFRGD